MKTPNYDKASVQPEKITEYLLSATHTEGKSKAAFFIHFGFSIDSWENLEEALLEHVASHDVTRSVESRFGVRYVVEGTLNTPDGRNPQVRSVWFIARGYENPRLVTAYPLEA